jgi:transcription elongation GreA/GreB family factor
MEYEILQSYAKSNRWSELEKSWLSLIEKPDADQALLLPVIDTVVKAGQGPLANTLGWAWLSTVKERKPAAQALQIGRELLVRLTDAETLRDELLTLYRKSHADSPNLDQWLDRSGLKSGKSVRRALRFLDIGLQLKPGAYLLHRTDDQAAKITELDLDADSATIQLGRRTQTLEIAELIDDYDVADENDFRVLQQLAPERIALLIKEDPATLVTGILRSHNNKMNRDALKVMLVPRFVAPDKWSDWWSRVRDQTKKSRNLRIEGRSPMFIIFDPAGQSVEQETWTAFSKATTPREWLEVLEAYLREIKQQKLPPDTGFLDRTQKALVDHIARFGRHKEPVLAFTTALVIERVAADGLPVSTDAHGMALEMLSKSANPVVIVGNVTDSRLWSLAVDCLEQAFPEEAPQLLSELILFAAAGQCDALAKKIEKAGKGESLVPIVQRALADPGRYTDAVMWIWKGPDVKVNLVLPPLMEQLSLILTLVGPSRVSEGKAIGQTVNEMRARVRAGLSARDYAQYRLVLEGLDDGMALAVRRLIERAEGLGPSLQEDMGNILRARFPKMYVKPKVAMWDDEGTLYFTERGLKTKETELNEIVNVKMRENAKAIGEAASHGDLSENSEYKFALEERDLLRARLAKLNRELAMAKILDKADVPTDHVSIAQKITLKPTAGGPPLVLTIMGADESDLSKSVYSYQSPLARQFLGMKLGDKVPVNFESYSGDYALEKIEPAV